MTSSKIQSVSVEILDDLMICKIKSDVVESDKSQFAFYIMRNDIAVVKTSYSRSDTFEFDTKGVPGYYKVVGFLRCPDGLREAAKSPPIHFKPYELNTQNFADFNGDLTAYTLKGQVWDFPALYYPHAEPTLFVMMPSAIDRKKIVPPAFHRWTWANQGIFPGHMLCIADPTLELHSKLRLGWFLGNKSNNAIEDLAKLVERFAAEKDIPNHKIVVYGSSAGGFAALALASYIKGSVAVAINAQTDILNYQIRREVALIRETCFDGMSEQEIRSEFADRVDMSSRWKDVDSSKVLFVQNELDTHHYVKHFKPFWSILGGSSYEGISTAGKHSAWVYKDERGHVPETLEMAKRIVEMLGSA